MPEITTLGELILWVINWPDDTVLILKDNGWFAIPGCGAISTVDNDSGIAVLPAGPVAPVAPVGPVAPVATVGPVGPVGPVAPVGPVGPVGPKQNLWIFLQHSSKLLYFILDQHLSKLIYV